MNISNLQNETKSEVSLKTIRLDLCLQIHKQPINSADFSKNDKNYLLTSGYDNLISIFDLDAVESVQKIDAGSIHLTEVDNSIFLNSSKSILFSSLKNYKVNQFSLENNEVVHSFIGHYNKITEISQNPTNEKYFISSSLDRTTRLWDNSKRSCFYIIEDSNCAAFDNKGKLLVSVTSENKKLSDEIIKFTNYVNIYSLSHIHEGPFKVFQIEGMGIISKVKFSEDGSSLIFEDTNSSVKVFDVFDDSLMFQLSPELNKNFPPIGSSNDQILENTNSLLKFDVKDDYLAIGSIQGKVSIWDFHKGLIVNILNNHHDITQCVKFSNKFSSSKNNLIVTACKDISIWKY